MKATAKAPANIAFIKYWGRKDEKLRLPANNSISMNLSEVFTITTIGFLEKLKEDEVELDRKELSKKEKSKICNHLDRIRSLSGVRMYAKVVTQNNFPKGAGIASSASGFAALSVAAASAVGLDLSQKQLSIISRQGSGSACRSIPDGFVEWRAGNSSESSYAYSLFPPKWWDIRDIVVIVGETMKKVGSSEGHVLTESSPFYKARILGMKAKLKKMKEALDGKNFKEFGEILEAEALNMHAVMMTSSPSLFYWLPKTMEMILAIQDWREEGILAYFTVDAGPNVHLICQAADEKKVLKKLEAMKGIKNVIVNLPAEGARLINNHLF